MSQQMIYLGDEAQRLIKPLLESRQFSQWVEDQILNNLKDEKALKKEIDNMQLELDSKKEQLKAIGEFNSKVAMDVAKTQTEMSNYETLWWKNCIYVLENRGREYADGQRMAYNNEFSKNMNKFDFLKRYESMLKEFGPQAEATI